MRRDLLYHDPIRMKIEGINMTYEGLVPRTQGPFLAKDVGTVHPPIRALGERAGTFTREAGRGPRVAASRN